MDLAVSQIKTSFTIIFNKQFVFMYKFLFKPVAFFLPFVFMLTACSIDGEADTETSLPVNVVTYTSSSTLAQQVYNVLLGEMYGRYGDIDTSLSYYMKVIKENNSADVAKRVTALASKGNKNKSAMVAAEEWAKVSPDSVDAHQYLALLNIRTKKPEAAAKELLWIQQYLDKKNKHGFAFVASLISFEADKDVAYQAFKIFSKQSGKPDEAGLALAALALNAGKFEDVIEATSSIRKSKNQKIKDKANIYYAKAMMSLDREVEAAKVLKPIVASSENADLKLEYARLLILAEKYEEARKVFNTLYKNHPDNVDILYTLGLLYFDMKNFSDAQPLFEKLAKLPNTKKSDEAQYFLGKIYAEQGDYTGALAAYSKAEDTEFYQEAEISKTKLILEKEGLAAAKKYLQGRIDNSDDDEEIISLLLVEGQILYQKKMYDDALKSYKKILDLKPDDFDGLYSRSLVYSQMGDIKNAEKDLKQILSSTPDNVTALNALGYSLAVYTKRYDEAKKYISKALKLRPDDPAIIDSMGWIEYRSGNLEAAEEQLRKAYKGLPDPEVASHLIEVLFKRGKVTEAQKLLTEMLKKHANDENLISVQKKLADLGTN